MKLLTLIRHAKSDWNHPQLSDAERPLNKRGLRDAPKMAEHFASKYKPSHWYISPARRAQQTATFFTAVQKTKHTSILTESVLYSFNTQQVINFIQSLDKAVLHAALLFHNPTISELAHYYCSSFICEVPTCATITLQFELDQWMEIHKDSGIVVDYDYPKRHEWALNND